MLLFNSARKCEIFVARLQILFKQIVNVLNFSLGPEYILWDILWATITIFPGGFLQIFWGISSLNPLGTGLFWNLRGPGGGLARPQGEIVIVAHKMSPEYIFWS